MMAKKRSTKIRKINNQLRSCFKIINTVTSNIMWSTFKTLFYTNRNKEKAGGTTAAMCRISIAGKFDAHNGANFVLYNSKFEMKNGKI